MTQTEEEELKRTYEATNKDPKSLDEKVRTSMLEIIKLDDPNEGFPVFKYVIENFSREELAHLGCLYIGSHMVKMMEENPEFKQLCSLIKALENAGKKFKNE